jgi:cysteine desulfurase/selenocysteine lyase
MLESALIEPKVDERADMLDVEKVRRDFPILSHEVWGHPLVYLDNAATTQVPEPVLQTALEHYRCDNANVHRGIHRLSELSTQSYESARHRMAEFIDAPDDGCIVFTRGTTDGINMAAIGLEHLVGPGDRIVASMLEHHSNLVPWQQCAKRTGADFIAVGLTEEGDIDLHALEEALVFGAKIVAVSCCSNILGTVTPVERIVEMAHRAGALCLLDGAQVMRHRLIDVQAIGCDLFAFSGHKMMGPTGIGVLYVAPGIQSVLEPSAFGGEMVDRVSVKEATFEAAPLRYEAGTPNYVGAIMLGAAADYLESIGREDVAAYEDALISYAETRLASIDGLHILGSPRHRSGCLSFTVDHVHPFDLCALADKLGIALRSGTSCAQPLLEDVYGIPYVSRLSVAFYNTFGEIDRAAEALEQVIPLVRQGA